jgi:NAD(P)-dependent dehydrogenase (short-subunit alcohol dehydrogenase family)
MKTVLITGCSSGFGRLLVPKLLDSGWQVIATLRNAQARSELFKEECEKYPQALTLLELDVTQEGDIVKIASWVEAHLEGRLDCLINNAGFGVYGAFEDLSMDQLRDQMETNFFGLVSLTQKLLPALRHAKGRLINVSSVLGFAGLPLTSAYCASKFAVEGLTEALRFELAPHGVQVALVEPGSFPSGFISNVQWGQRSSDVSSPYFAQTRAFREFRSRRSKPKSAESVIEAIYGAMECTHLPLRIRCGREPWLFYCLRKYFPTCLEEWVLKKIFAKMFGVRLE